MESLLIVHDPYSEMVKLPVILIDFLRAADCLAARNLHLPSFMSQNPVIVCQPTQWIKIRAVLILLMFGVFTFLFYQDGTVGYREKNAHYLFHHLFLKKAPEQVQNFEDAGAWKAFVAQADFPIPSEEECPLPADFDKEQKWPAVLGTAESFAKMQNESDAASKLWQTYSGERGWDFEPSEKLFDQGKLNEQFYMAGLCGVLVLVVLFLFVRTLGRTMQVTEEAYIAPGGKVVPFAAMRRIDARKWDVKGIALIEYEDAQGGMRKAKVDGMIYGQFKEEDGRPAEQLYAYILERFKGELIEFEAEEEEQVEDGEASQDERAKNSEEAANS